MLINYSKKSEEIVVTYRYPRILLRGVLLNK
jgi:hypothetical protein